MPPINSMAFYPSTPFWAGSSLDFSDQSKQRWLVSQLEEEVFVKVTDAYSVTVCRDGRIVLRIESLERDVASFGEIEAWQEILKTWGSYLEFLNSLYLLLDSATIEIMSLCFFKLHEITIRDAFRISKFAESHATDSITSVFQERRFYPYSNSGVSPEQDFFYSRLVIPLSVIERTCDLFELVIERSGSEKDLATFTKSLSEYKVGNFELSVVLAWFVSERSVNKIFQDNIEVLDTRLPNGQYQFKQARKQHEKGKFLKISAVLNILMECKLIPDQLYSDLDKVRNYRNDIAHALNYSPASDHAELAIQTARAMIEKIWGLSINLNMSYSVDSL